MTALALVAALLLVLVLTYGSALYWVHVVRPAPLRRR